jgi:hypothetical protein
MKQLLIIPFVLFGACASHGPRKIKVTPSTPPSRAPSAAVLRTGEQLREYRFGRYTDPGDSRVMHEGHPVYRVEQTSQWNLRPGNAATPSSRVAASPPSASTNDAVVAEVNKQRAATRAVTEQTATLNQRLGEMAQAAGHSQELIKQTLAFKREMTALRDRMDSFDAQLRERTPAAADRTPPRADDKW